jgi:parvulin-like peptidyl-prolyl isomerase
VTPTSTGEASTPEPTATTAPSTPTPVPELPTASPTPYTLEGFQEEFKTTLDSFAEFGVSEQTIRGIYEAQLYREKLQAELTQDLPPTEEQVLARHILVETEEEANAIYERLQNGEDFAAVALETSQDTGSAANGGVLDWQPRSFFVTEFGDAAFSQEIGEIGQPVKTDFGYHIIQVIAREDIALNATQYEQKKETVFTDWLTATREDSDITTYEGWKQVVPTEPALQAEQPAIPQ